MEIIVRATVIYIFLWVVARGWAKRELSEMTAFELILLVTMGDLIQQGATQEDQSITGAFLAVGTLAFWILVFSYLSFRCRSSADITVEDGQATIRAAMRTAAGKDYILHEWHYGPYQRTVDLPDGFGGAGAATFGNGQLALRVERGDPSPGPVVVHPTTAG